MTRTPTPRLKLIKETDSELIDQYEYNWPILDTLAGALMVNPGITPPDSQLFQGCIVGEKNNGKFWMAYKNPATGFFEKKWLFYPWSLEATKHLVNVPNNPGVAQKANFDGIGDADKCYNSSAADIVGGRIIAPVDALYEINWNCRANTAKTGNVPFSCYVEVNDDGAYLTNEMIQPMNDSIYTAWNGSRLWRMIQGTQVSWIYWNGTTVTQASVDFTCTVSVVTCC